MSDNRPRANGKIALGLDIDKSTPNFVLGASIITSLGLCLSFFTFDLLKYDGSLITPGIISAAILLGSSLQKTYLPLSGEPERDLKYSHISGEIVRQSVINAVALLLRYYAAYTLGPLRAALALVPMSGLLRANIGGYLTISQSSLFTTISGVALLFITDLYNLDWKSTLFGYGCVLGSFVLLNIGPTEKPRIQIQLLAVPLLVIWSVLERLYLPFALTFDPIVTGVCFLGGVCGLAWYPSLPRQVATTLQITWPLGLISIAFLHYLSEGEIPYFDYLGAVMVWTGLCGAIPSNEAAITSHSVANKIPDRLSDAGKGLLSNYYIREIVKNKQSRDIFFFLLLNLSFMVVQMLYGIWTNSLGLISDSIHMAFDCLALAVGLVAAVMSRWPASLNYPFGFAKIEIISGFANGVLLILISISIMVEAIERLMEPPEMKTDQLLFISTLGLCVNLVGIFAFNHGHGHGHGHGHEHSHGHEQVLNHDRGRSLEPLPTILTPHSSHTRESPLIHPDIASTPVSHKPGMLSGGQMNGNTRGISSPKRPSSPLKSGFSADELGVSAPITPVRGATPIRYESPQRSPSPEHALGLKCDNDEHHAHADGTSQGNDHTPCPASSHDHHHHHHHHHDHNLHGIFLHILADTLGSAGVIVSTLLIRQFGWTGFDPLASIFIAVLIFASVVPLITASFKDLLLAIGEHQEYNIREVLGEVSLLNGVGQITFIRFWLDGEKAIHGIVTIRCGIDGDLENVRTKVKRKLTNGITGLKDVVVQVDREATSKE